ncbi:MAG: hypothetical protein LBB95_00980 [Mycoplasmataceae bacterium]|nr:hypothetical protein [Mycoplasmataceae bacterium]
MKSLKKTLYFLTPVLLISGLVAGSSVCIWQSSKNYVLSDEFGKTNAYRIQLNSDVVDEHSPEETAKDFSNYLQYKGIPTYSNVYVDKDSTNNWYLNFSIPIERGVPANDPNADKDTKQDIPGMTTLFNTMNSNDIDFIVDLDTSKANQDINTNAGQSSGVIFNSSNLITSDSQISQVKNKNELVLKLSDSSSTTDQKLISKKNWNDFYEYFMKKVDSSVNDDNSATPEIYIVRDKESLISRMHYILNCYFAHYGNFTSSSDDNINEFYSYEKGYYFLSSDETSWAKKVTGSATSIPNSMNFLQGSLFSYQNEYIPYAQDLNDFFDKIQNGEHFASTVATNSCNGYENGGNWYKDEKNNDALFYRLIDADRSTQVYNSGSASIPAGIGASDDKTFSSDYGWDWMKPYIAGIINKSNFTSFFPDKNPLDSGDKSDETKIGNWFVLGNNGAEITTYSNYDFKILHNSLLVGNSKDRMANPMKFNVIREDNTWRWNDASSMYGPGSLFTDLISHHSIFSYDRKLSNGWIISNPVIGIFVGILIILVAIGILVSLLYRIPGLLFFGSLYSTFGFSIFFLTLAGKIISIGLLLGIIAGIVMSTAAFLAIMQRMKKHTTKNDFVLNAAKKGASKGIWQFLDLHFITIIIGAVFLYFGTLSGVNFGVSLMIYSLLSLGIMFIWAISSLLLFWNKQNEKNIEYIFNKNKLPELDFSTRTEVVNETSFATVKRFTKFNSFGIKKELIGLGVILSLIIVGIVLLFTIGNHNAYEFLGGCKIVIFTNTDTDPQTILNNLANAGIKWSNISKEQNCWIITTSLSYDLVYSKINTISGFGSNFILQLIPSGILNTDILTLIIATLILGGFMSLYALIRLNWTSIVPMFLSVCFMPMLFICIIEIFQIYIDNNFLIFYCLFITINAIFSTLFIADINNAWIKQKYHTYKNLRSAINDEIKSICVNYFIYVTSVVLGIMLIFLCFSSTVLLVPVACLIVSIICSILTLAFVVKPVLFWMIIIRYWYKVKVGQNNVFFLTNFDPIDEQSIEGLNLHKKQKIIL